MRPFRALVLYFIAVFVGGGLLAPWLYWACLHLGLHSAIFASLASNPFRRFVGRAVLGVAIIGLWPLLRSCQMLRWRDLGLSWRGRPLLAMAFGFAVGFLSLALVAILACWLGGRFYVSGTPWRDIAKLFLKSTTAAAIVAVLEEFIFRATLFGILRKAQSWPVALVVSSAVYALVHFIQNTSIAGPVHWLSGLVLLGRMFQAGPAFVPAGLTLFLAGSALALAYQRTGTLFFSIGLHAGWIFWLKSYGFFTAKIPTASTVLWGSDRLIDGWLALPILGGVCWMVSRLKPATGEPHAS